jgi:exodeoxyribonuclease V alpha subunit
MVITGGPGTGKTTLVKTLLKVLESKQLVIKLCAPTGRAAKRLSETTGLEATTIHRLLEIDQVQGGFKYNDENRLSCDYLIVDESSMIDVPLFYSLIKALPDNTGLLLVGDVDQLPSVGAGQVLKDIINSNIIKTIRLTQIYRQAATSDIVTNAHNINKGILPNLSSPKDGTDFYFIEAEPGDDIVNKIITITAERIPKKFNLDPIHDIQLLCPMQRGGSGARSLNIELQKALNPNHSNGIVKFGQTFAVGDKVMQTENNYDKETYNGDIGVITDINQEEQEIAINFYNNIIIYDYTDLDQITLAYATTIHKSQGSEYPAVIIPITMQSYMMLKRNLIYTAVTRGKKLVVLIGQKKALAMAVTDTKSSNRYSKLKDWLQQSFY